LDIQRPDLVRKRRLRRILVTIAVLLGVGALSFGLSRLEPASPEVERATLVIDTVARGELLVDRRGLGTLVPEEILFIPANDEGRVERRLVLPGTPVTPETILIELSNPRVEQELFDAESQVKGAEAEYSSLKVKLETDRLDQEATAAQVESEYQQAKAQYEADAELHKSGLIDTLTLRKSQVSAEQLAIRTRLERERLAIRDQTVTAQLASQQQKIEQARALSRLKKLQVDRLKVRAGAAGVMQQLEVQVGQFVTPGTVLARVSDPRRLKAELKIPETQARDIQFGQKAEIDTRNGFIPGTVTRIDPAVIEGTVTVDVRLDAEPPLGARPDLSVDGKIEIDRIASALKVGRPVYAQADRTISLFKLDSTGQFAGRIPVKVGKVSVNEIEILEGLREGDQVILSDMSAQDAFDRIRLN
jgi:multidrug resistance efflux pump